MNIYATDGLIKGSHLDITATSIFTDTITTPTEKLSSIEYSDSSGLDKLKFQSGTDVEFRDKSNVALFKVNATHGFIMWRDLVLNKFVIAGAEHVGAYNARNAEDNIFANNSFYLLSY